MKETITYLFVLLLIGPGCRKQLDANGLPKATQEGKNTLGFLLNGQPWAPKGFSGTGNLSIDFDPGIRKGIMGIVAYRTMSNSDQTQFLLGIGDSLNFKQAPFTVAVQPGSLGAMSFSTKEYCDLNHNDPGTFRSGEITVTRLDRSNGIVSGTFHVTLYKSSCGDTIRITEGRFDMKF